MKALSILALAAATLATPIWAGQTAVTVTQVAGPVTSTPYTPSYLTAYLVPDGEDNIRLRFVIVGTRITGDNTQ